MPFLCFMFSIPHHKYGIFWKLFSRFIHFCHSFINNICHFRKKKYNFPLLNNISLSESAVTLVYLMISACVRSLFILLLDIPTRFLQDLSWYRRHFWNKKTTPFRLPLKLFSPSHGRQWKPYMSSVLWFFLLSSEFTYSQKKWGWIYITVENNWAS